MALLEIKNALRSGSIVKVVDAGAATITLDSLSVNTAMEMVTTASIRRVLWSTNGNISVVRNGVNILTLHGTGNMDFQEMGHSVANNSTQSIVVTINTGGTILLDITKDAVYNVALVGM